MRAMLLRQPGGPLEPVEWPEPIPGPGEVRIKVTACGVCRTDLHIIDGELPEARFPIIPGHEVVGIIDAVGPDVPARRVGERAGVGWLGHACGNCSYCHLGHENLCDHPQFTGCTGHGGFATHMIADARYTYSLRGFGADDPSLAPLMCAGLIGWRSLVMAGEASRLGIYGFGAAGHIILQVARAQGRRVFVFTRSGDQDTQIFARALGADWVGSSEDMPPEPLDAVILYAPVGALVPAALRAVRKGGRVVCAGIHMTDIPAFPYRWLWGERQIMSVANLTRADADAFLQVARQMDITAHVTIYPLADANRAIGDLRAGKVRGAAVLRP